VQRYLVETVEGDLVMPARPDRRGRRRLGDHRGRQVAGGAVGGVRLGGRSAASGGDDFRSGGHRRRGVERGI
jgi:hypothetical protein